VVNAECNSERLIKTGGHLAAGGAETFSAELSSSEEPNGVIT